MALPRATTAVVVALTVAVIAWFFAAKKHAAPESVHHLDESVRADVNVVPRDQTIPPPREHDDSTSSSPQLPDERAAAVKHMMKLVMGRRAAQASAVVKTPT